MRRSRDNGSSGCAALRRLTAFAIQVIERLVYVREFLAHLTFLPGRPGGDHDPLRLVNSRRMPGKVGRRLHPMVIFSMNLSILMCLWVCPPSP